MSLSSDRFSAIAFDFDGTLVDTMPLHYEAYRRVFNSLGMELAPDLFYGNIGGKASETIPLFLAGRKTSLSVDEIHRRKKATLTELLNESTPPILPSAKLLKMFHGICPIALVSAGSRLGIMQIITNLNWNDYFTTIVTGDDCKRSKPDPEPYLMAAQKLNVNAADVLVFEDTVAGVNSAKAAGMMVLNVDQLGSHIL